jgi:hypothetical protein
MSRTSQRLAAVCLGLALCTPLAAVVAWQSWLPRGDELCIRCGSMREITGPIAWSASDAPSEFLAACLAHTWNRAGCWSGGGGFSKYATPPVLSWAVARVLAGEHEVSIPKLQAFVESTPPSAQGLRTEARAWLAYALNESGDPEGCLAELEIAVAEDPRDPWLLYEQGHAWSAIGDYEQAIASYRAAVDLDPAFARAWQWLGHCLLLVERPDEALAADTRALELAERADERELEYWRAGRTTLLLEILGERARCLEALGEREAARRDRARAEGLRAAR